MTQKQIINLPIEAGVYTEQTERGAQGRWYSADKVRFRKGMAEKLGGWVQKNPQFLGTCRRLHDWTSLDGKLWTAIATELKLYLWQSENLYDITPIRAEGALTDPFDVTDTETEVTVNHVAHGGQVGDFVRFSGADAVGGITIDGEYRIVTSDTDSYTIEHSAAATSTVSGGGGTVSYLYDISAGASTATTATGYGTGPYGREGYGNARTGSTVVIRLRTWALDNWGEDLIASFAGGAIYWWDRSTGSSARATLLASAPQVNQYMIISQQDRHVFALGAYDDFNGTPDPLLIRWNTSEDLNDWEADDNNTAGDIRIFRGSKIITGIRSRLETLVFTDISVHTIQGFGNGNFGQNVVGENVSIVGPNGAVAIDHRVLFMADTDFYIYDGIVRVMPCSVRNFVFEHLNNDQKDKVYACTNKMFNEAWWFYPSRDPLAWVQQDFSLGLPSGYSLATGSGTIGYSYVFNSSGYTIPAGSAANGYEHDYVLTNDESLLTPLDAEYAVELDISPDYNGGPKYAGLCFLRTEISGTADTNADDASQFMVELDFDEDEIRIRKKGLTGTIAAPDALTGANTADFAVVTGDSMVAGQKYVIMVQVDAPRIRVWIDSTDNEAFDFNMSAQELLDFTGGTAGLHVAANADSDNSYRFYNFAASPLNVITAEGFDISPIEINRYVALNYEEGTWTTGRMVRTAWTDKSPVLDRPYATGIDGYIYQHETGVDDNGAAMECSLESFDMEIGAGEELMHVDQLIPDFLTLEGSVDVSVTGKKYPGDQTRLSKGPYPVIPGTRKVSTRFRARQVAIKIESDAIGDKWRMGHWRGRAGAHGKRG